jgi:hypothetical protein
VNTSKERSGYRWGGESRARTERTAEERERDASKWARWAAAVVLILGTAFIVAPAARHLGHIWENPFEPSQTVKRVVKTGAGETEVTTTTGEAIGPSSKGRWQREGCCYCESASSPLLPSWLVLWSSGRLWATLL